MANCQEKAYFGCCSLRKASEENFWERDIQLYFFYIFMFLKKNFYCHQRIFSTNIFRLESKNGKHCLLIICKVLCEFSSAFYVWRMCTSASRMRARVWTANSNRLRMYQEGFVNCSLLLICTVSAVRFMQGSSQGRGLKVLWSPLWWLSNLEKRITFFLPEAHDSLVINEHHKVLFFY